jgi:hypothetical protein
MPNRAGKSGGPGPRSPAAAQVAKPRHPVVAGLLVTAANDPPFPLPFPPLPNSSSHGGSRAIPASLQNWQGRAAPGLEGSIPSPRRGCKFSVRRSYNAHGGVGSPKSGRVRSVPMIPDVAAGLARIGEREASADEEDLVFPGQFGLFQDATSLRARYKVALSQAGLRPFAVSRPQAHVRDARGAARGGARGPVLDGARRHRDDHAVRPPSRSRWTGEAARRGVRDRRSGRRRRREQKAAICREASRSVPRRPLASGELSYRDAPRCELPAIVEICAAGTSETDSS